MTVSVYKYFGDGDSLLYVGITGRRRQRQFEHVSDSIWWHLVFRCEIEHFFDRAMALERERSLIRDLKPRFNVMLSVTRDTRRKAAQDAMKDGNRMIGKKASRQR